MVYFTVQPEGVLKCFVDFRHLCIYCAVYAFEGFIHWMHLNVVGCVKGFGWAGLSSCDGAGIFINLLYVTHHACHSPDSLSCKSSTSWSQIPHWRKCLISNIKASDFIPRWLWNADLLKNHSESSQYKWRWTFSAVVNSLRRPALICNSKYIPQCHSCLICILILRKENGNRSRLTWKQLLWNVDCDNEIFRF